MVEVAADGWLGNLLSGAEDRTLEPTPTPDGFFGQLRPYQERGLGWLAFLGDLGLGACLADDMGLGKTAQLLALLVHERAETPLLPNRDPDALGPGWPDARPVSHVPGWQLAARDHSFRTAIVRVCPPWARPTRRQGVCAAGGPGGPGPVDLRPGHA